MQLFTYLSAAGTSDNSPTFQRRVCVRNGLSPGREGRRPNHDPCSQPLQPSRSGLMAVCPSSPTLKRWAIIACPSGTKGWRWREPIDPSNSKRATSGRSEARRLLLAPRLQPGEHRPGTPSAVSTASRPLAQSGACRFSGAGLVADEPSGCTRAYRITSKPRSNSL